MNYKKIIYALSSVVALEGLVNAARIILRILHEPRIETGFFFPDMLFLAGIMLTFAIAVIYIFALILTIWLLKRKNTGGFADRLEKPLALIALGITIHRGLDVYILPSFYPTLAGLGFYMGILLFLAGFCFLVYELVQKTRGAYS